MDFTKLPNYQAALSKFTEAVSADKPKEEQDKLYNEAMTVMADEMMETLGHQSTDQLNALLASNPLNQKMSAEEVKFFDEITTDVGTKSEVVFPETLINQVFVELALAHPLLDVIKFQSAGLRLKAVVASDQTGAAVWGKIGADIRGQLDATFAEEEFGQNKLTTFVAIPKDSLSYGYDWLKTFIINQVSEAMAIALETALVTGNGVDMPVGLIKDAVETNGAITYADKTVGADFSPLLSLDNAEAVAHESAKILAPAMQKMSVNVKGKPVNISGQVKLLVNPSDYYSLVSMFLYLNANGVWVDSLPFNIQVVQSIAVPVGKAILFAANRYWAYAGNMTMQEYDQTLALEDLQLYTNKAFYYGKPYDNNTAVLVNIAPSA